MCVLVNDIFVKYQQLSDIMTVPDTTDIGVACVTKRHMSAAK